MIKAMQSANSALLLKNLTANEDIFPNGGFPITKYVLSFSGIKLKKSIFFIPSYFGSKSIPILLLLSNNLKNDPFPALGSK